jgi:hypothetical protein
LLILSFDIDICFDQRDFEDQCRGLVSAAVEFSADVTRVQCVHSMQFGIELEQLFGGRARASSAMSEHASILSNVMLELDYGQEDLPLRIQDASRWAEEKRVELHRQLQRMTGQGIPRVPPSVL